MRAHAADRPGPGRATPERHLLRRTALRLGAQVAVMVAAVVVLLTGLATLVVIGNQSSAATTLLIDAVAKAEDVDDPPAGVWLALETATDLRVTPGMPTGLPDAGALRRVAKSGVAETAVVTVDHDDFRVHTARVGRNVVQAVLDLRPDEAERARLLQALLVSGGIGLVLAAGAGVWFGRLAVRPIASALAMQRRFVSDASHELRTPLTLLSTRAQLLRRQLHRGATAASLRSDVDGLVADASQLSATLDDLLLAVDPRAEAPAEAVDLTALARDVAEASAPTADDRSVTISVNSGGATVDVVGSRAGLRRAVTALVDNAIRHTTSAVTITVSTRDRLAVLDVADDGPGIDPAIMARLFERTASSAPRDDQDGSAGSAAGTRRSYGLGLALVSEITSRHHGNVEAENRPGGGALIRMSIPRA